MNILEEIVQYKRNEVASAKLIYPICELEQLKHYSRPTLKLTDFIMMEEKTRIIAEYKRKSPSKGIINDHSAVEVVTTGYSAAGASALSILTDFNFFGGSVADILKARAVHEIAILRKEFIIDEYQSYEAKAVGSDAILLIAAILTKKQALQLAKKAHELKLQVLMELHDKSELEILNDHLDIVGVNNRNLKTFDVDLKHSVQLAKKIPKEFLKISESGISSAKDIKYLSEHGFNGFLIGERFMKTPDPVKAFNEFIQTL